jgi:hypothetical protein
VVVTTSTASSEQARETLRREHAVRLVAATEEGYAAADLPGGVYGFTSSPALASPLFAKRQYRNFEVHHQPNDVVSLVGFVTPAEARQLTSGQRDVVTLVVHPDAEGDATAIVSLPYDRVAHHRQYSILNSAAITLQIVPPDQSVPV